MLIDYVKAVLENGHTAMIVTNGTLTKRFKEYVKLPKPLLSRLGFKFSFHYLELKRLGLIDVFFNNVIMIREAGCSISVEVTPNDEYEPYIEEIKGLCVKYVGAPCHLSVPRENDKAISLKSKHSLNEFYNIWKVFDSKMFEFKTSIWGQKRHEYCNAGYTSGLLDLGTGEMKACYEQKFMVQNIFQNLQKHVVWCSVGKCKIAHCYNNHAMLTFGNIPSICSHTYCDIRDREVVWKGKKHFHWVNDEMREQFSSRLHDYNKLVTKGMRIKFFFDRIGLKTKNFTNKALKRLGLKRK